MNVEITTIFWDLLEKILALDYNDLIHTDEYKKLSFYINYEFTFLLTIEKDIRIETDDVNELFLKTKYIYESRYPQTQKYQLINSALTKIEKYLKTEDEIDNLFNNFKI